MIGHLTRLGTASLVAFLIGLFAMQAAMAQQNQRHTRELLSSHDATSVGISRPTSAARSGHGLAPAHEYSPQEIVAAGHQFFGSISGGLASVVERGIAQNKLPNGYILGEEASGAFFGGLRYGEGTLYTRNAGQHKVYWQGPSVGWDVGGNGSRVMMLVYDLPNIDHIYHRYVGLNGTAYVVGGLDVQAMGYQDTLVMPLRSGLGARVGINMGYLKFTRTPTWNPF